MNKEIEKGEIYRLAIIKINSRDTKIGRHNIEGSMLVHLLESIIARYQMGTLFAPYGKEIFVIFHFDRVIGFEARKRQLEHEWNSDQTLVQSISAAASIAEMKQVIISIVYQFRSDCTDELDRDELASAFSYIEQHLSEKITLNDLTDLCHMSAPSFCKKFKERTGKTLVQYLNTRRIEKAKGLMKNRKYSLWDISEMTGFSNANYMIRVFKKITGQTVSEYRRQFGIIESEEERS